MSTDPNPVTQALDDYGAAVRAKHVQAVVDLYDEDEG